ncbi:MAG: leucine-rich repeat domain-containing protein [Paludibacteraceae bacterium]|nr:leucine-rich repeat domain-containing protein [Paludibacteraceae bacterium]
MSVFALAASADSWESGLSICGTKVTSANVDDLNALTKSQVTAGTMSYNNETGVLTLNKLAMDRTDKYSTFFRFDKTTDRKEYYVKVNGLCSFDNKGIKAKSAFFAGEGVTVIFDGEHSDPAEDEMDFYTGNGILGDKDAIIRIKNLTIEHNEIVFTLGGNGSSSRLAELSLINCNLTAEDESGIFEYTNDFKMDLCVFVTPADATFNASTYCVESKGAALTHMLIKIKAKDPAVKIGELYYNLNDEDHTAEVTYEPGERYKGSVTIPATVTSDASVTYDVTSIGEYAFSTCDDLTAVTIPSSIVTIGNWAFYNCSKLVSINVAKDNSTFMSEGGVVYSKDKSILVAYPSGKTGNFPVPNSVKSIGPCAFASNQNIKKVSLPNQLATIESNAFFECKALTTINIPNAVTAIGKDAFSNCAALSSITCKAVTPPTCDGESVFSGVDKTIPLYVPKNSVDTYIHADVWKLFKNNTYAIESAIDDVNKADEINSRKVMQNGVLYIERNGELFNATGARVK